MTDPLTTATDAIRKLARRKQNPVSWLEAAFIVSERMSTDDATQVLTQLIQRQFLCTHDGDLAQMLAAKLGVELRWSHTNLAGRW